MTKSKAAVAAAAAAAAATVTAAVDSSAVVADSTALTAEGAADAAAEGEAEVRKVGDDKYATKQQEKAASGPDGIDQYELPKTQVARVAKAANPDNVQLRKEVLLGLIKSSTVFINYLSAAALEKTHEAGVKTISAQHVLAAFKEMGFPESYAAQLRRDYNDKVRAEAEKLTSKAAANTPPVEADAIEGETQQAMEVDEGAAGDESMAVGDETLAAADAADGDDDDDDDKEDEVEAEGRGAEDD